MQVFLTEIGKKLQSDRVFHRGTIQGNFGFSVGGDRAASGLARVGGVVSERSGAALRGSAQGRARAAAAGLAESSA